MSELITYKEGKLLKATLKKGNLKVKNHRKAAWESDNIKVATVSGKGKIIADGSCDELALRMVGTGEIQADRVIATQVTCRIMGTGSLGCNVNGGELKVSGSGTGKVYYKGNPSKVTVHKLGTIKAIPMQ